MNFYEHIMNQRAGGSNVLYYFSYKRFEKAFTVDQLEVGKHYKFFDNIKPFTGFVIESDRGKWILCTNDGDYYQGPPTPISYIRYATEAPIPDYWTGDLKFKTETKWFDVKKNSFIFVKKQDEKTVSQKSTPVQKRDPYKEHEERMKNDPGFKTFVSDQHECSLCGKLGSGERSHIIKSTLINEPIHSHCEMLISYYATVFNVSETEAFEALKYQFDKRNQKTIKKTEIKMLGTSSIGKNPWNK